MRYQWAVYMRSSPFPAGPRGRSPLGTPRGGGVVCEAHTVKLQLQQSAGSMVSGLATRHL